MKKLPESWYRWANFGKDPLSRQMHLAAHAYLYGEEHARSMYTPGGWEALYGGQDR